MAKRKISRRRFLEGTGAALSAAAAAPALRAQQRPGSATGSTAAPGAAPRTTITLTINGASRRVEVEDRWTLAEALRDHLGLTGTKIGCDRGECGACTVLVDGKPRLACLTLAASCAGRSIETIESLAGNGRMSALQQAFHERLGTQCGFCTPGMVMSAEALLRANPRPSEDDIRRALGGNLCRCTGYVKIIESVQCACAAGA